MEMGGAAHSSCPASVRTAAHPQHQLLHTHLRRNDCNLCGGALAGEFGYRCGACDFDAHCCCIPEHRTTQPARSTVHAGVAHTTRPPPPATVQQQLQPPPPHAYHPPPRPPAATVQVQPVSHAHHGPAAPPPGPRPGSSPLSAWLPRPQLSFQLSLSPHLDIPHHTHGAQASVADPSHIQTYPAPQQNYDYERRSEPGAPAAYSHIQQQDYDPTTNSYGYQRGAEPDFPVSYNYNHVQQDYHTNNHGGCMDDYNEATDQFGHGEDYNETRDFTDVDDNYDDMDD